jgi:hypothetical protein
MAVARLTAAGLALGVLMANCGPNSRFVNDAPASDSGPSTPRSGCSVGPAYDAATTFKFPFESDPANGANDPTCTPRCGTGRSGGATMGPFPIESLPSGACEVNGEVCGMVAMVTCACPRELGPQSIYRCRCASGEWRCAILLAGTSVCILPGECADSGTDAGPD